MYNILSKFDKKFSASNSSISPFIDPEEAVVVIRKTWKLLLERKKEVGIEIYQKIVLKEVTLGKLFSQTNLNEQSSSFMNMLNTVIGYLDDLDSMEKKLIELGEKHGTTYNVQTRHFKHFRKAFLEGIKVYIPWSEKRENAWCWFWDKVTDNMSKATTDHALKKLNNKDGLTKEEIVNHCVLLNESLDALLEDPDKFAEEFYQTLLKEDANIAKLFGETNFKFQAAKFISMLTHAIRLLDNPVNLAIKLNALGRQHYKYGVKAEQLTVFGGVLTKHVKTKLDKKWTTKHRDAWVWFWKQLSETMIKSLKEVYQEKEKEKNKKNNNDNEEKEKDVSDKK